MGIPSLQPVAGAPADVVPLLRAWLDAEAEPEPLVVRTSGSSGRPKDVVLSRRAVTSSARATHARLGGPGRWLLDLPVTAVAGLQVLVRSLLAGTEPVVAADHPDLASAVGALGTGGARAYASLVPTQVHRLVRDGQVGVLAALDALLVGGAGMPVRLRQACADAGVNVVRTYGMSETAGGCVYDGVPLDGVAVRIDADHGVHLAGPVLFDGYGGDPDRTAAVLRDGWFATDDLGELDLDGRLRVLGRSDDVVVSGGVNVSLPAVTEALLAVDGVADALAVGVPDEEWGTRVVACVVGAAPLTTLRDAVEASGLPRAWGPRAVVALDALPLLPGGKVDRVALRALAAGAG
ncbi:AMP-binding protein [Solicola sp. PLA-1-18]|uniref:AMP-binding protein n=1 Tax=Solicola sp. PLA-1-18 TaxID=3380532 RepID=UPI003B77A4C9